MNKVAVFKDPGGALRYFCQEEAQWQEGEQRGEYYHIHWLFILLHISCNKICRQVERGLVTSRNLLPISGLALNTDRGPNSSGSVDVGSLGCAPKPFGKSEAEYLACFTFCPDFLT